MRVRFNGGPLHGEERVMQEYRQEIDVFLAPNLQPYFENPYGYAPLESKRGRYSIVRDTSGQVRADPHGIYDFEWDGKR